LVIPSVKKRKAISIPSGSVKRDLESDDEDDSYTRRKKIRDNDGNILEMFKVSQQELKVLILWLLPTQQQPARVLFLLLAR
jgi:hypothetical protein